MASSISSRHYVPIEAEIYKNTVLHFPSQPIISDYLRSAALTKEVFARNVSEVFARKKSPAAAKIDSFLTDFYLYATHIVCDKDISAKKTHEVVMQCVEELDVPPQVPKETISVFGRDLIATLIDCALQNSPEALEEMQGVLGVFGKDLDSFSIASALENSITNQS